MHTAAHIIFAKIKSRQSRVERKALVFFPTLNERLSSRLSRLIRSLPVAERRIAAPVGGIFISHLVLRKRRNEVSQKQLNSD
jgi:hypothetical protein